MVVTSRVWLASASWLVFTAAPAVAQNVPSPANEGQQADPRSPVPATDGASTVPPASNDGLGEIVVTANRVASNAQRTPIALSTYSADSLTQAGVHSVQALQTIDPSVNVTTQSGQPYVAIRGIASTDITEIGDPSVPIARDGFFVNRSYSIGTSFYDVARVEVLKGPQGTLFGRNSTGGLISIVTNRPGKEFGGYASVEGGNYDTINAEGGVNVPLGERVQVRLSGITQYNKGYRILEGVGGRGDDNNTVSGRAQLAFQPFDGFQGLIQYQHDDVDDVGDVQKLLPLGVVSPLGDPKRFLNYVPTSNRLVGDRVRWEFSYDNLPLGATLTYAGGYDFQRWDHLQDITQPGADPLRQFVQHETPKTWNNEVRIATSTNQRFTAQVGFFNFHEENTIGSAASIESATFAGQSLITFDYKVRTSSNAVFGQIGYEIVPNIRLSGGARYTWDEKVRTGQSALRCDVAGIPDFLFVPFGCAGTPPTIVGLSNGNLKESKPTFHAGVDWTPTAATLVYAKFDSGYKSGGFNSNGSQPSVDYGPEKLRAYEFGTKNKFLDNHLQLNIDGFYQDYAGYQASQVTAVVTSGSGVFNIGSATIYGVEAQLVALANRIGRVDINATYLHARFNDDVGLVARGDSAATLDNVSGNRLPNAPTLVVAGGLEHSFTIDDSTLTARVDGKYSSMFYYSVFNDPDTRSPRYATGNLSLTYVPAGGHFQVQAFIRNFTDRRILAYAARNYNSGFNNYAFQPPRTYGGRVSFNF